MDSVSSIQPFNLGVAAPPLVLPRAADGAIGVNDVSTSRSHAPYVRLTVVALPFASSSGQQVDVDAYNFAASAFSSPPLPEFELDGDCLSSPASSPIATPMMYGWCTDPEVGSPTSISDMMGEAYPSAPSPSSYSSLEGWAGSPLPKQASPISSPLPKVYHYVDAPGSPGVMEKAFDAASCAIYGEYWDDPGAAANNGSGNGNGTAGPAQAPYTWASEQVFSSYAFPAVHCHQDDL